MALTVTIPVWKDPLGNVVACAEKLKVMEENLAELAQLAQDTLEDAVLMGCDQRQVRDFMVQIMQNLDSQYAAR
ncbi:hypothetical protein HZU77_010525 [Neisseriaceae bacterium TC5R-5]|nr:hypothetical protein [Neisseriaceae bacterium TC5R-5]